MDKVAVRAMDMAHSGGASYVEVRVAENLSEGISVKNGAPQSLRRSSAAGIGVRVVYQGAWGFAACDDISPAAAERTARMALEVARASAGLKGESVRLAPEVPITAVWSTEVKTDPFAVPLEKKLELLARCCDIMAKASSVKITHGEMGFERLTQTLVTSEGSRVDQAVVISGAGIEAVAIGSGDVQRRSYPSSFRGQWGTGGYELVEELGLEANAERVGEEAAALLKADPCPSGETDLILDGNQLALQIHESLGHALELDRVLGMEAAYAGTSYLKPGDLVSYSFSSPKLNLTADATVKGGLGSFGYDDEGVPARRVVLVEGGVLKGFISNRESAARVGLPSSGAARASDWRHIPLVRMTNINLEPGEGSLDDLVGETSKGILMAVNRSWSIDDHRLNFQFATEVAWEIKSGVLGRMFKNPTYWGITPQFWASMDRVAGPEEWRMWGTPYCGKGQPAQLINVGHGCSPAKFRRVKVGVLKEGDVPSQGR